LRLRQRGSGDGCDATEMASAVTRFRSEGGQRLMNLQPESRNRISDSAGVSRIVVGTTHLSARIPSAAQYYAPRR